MKPTQRSNRTTQPMGLASTAGAMIALVAVAVTMTSLQGAGVRTALLESRVAPSDSTTVRAVAAAVAAAARELVGAERISAALPADRFASVLAIPVSAISTAVNSTQEIPSLVIDERLIDLPPPVC